MIEEHYAAVKELIRPGTTVYLWEVDAAPDYPYVLLWGSLGNELAPALADKHRDYELPVRITYVGLSPLSIVGLARDVREDLTGKRPLVEGWSVGKLDVTALAEMAPDESVSIPNFGHPLRAVDEVLLQSTRIL